jgi:FAD binding domain
VQTCVVEPGIVLDELNSALAPHGLMFGPRPATHDHCTLGGMLGNNSCGATAQAYGKTVDNVLRLEVLTYDGERFWAGPAPRLNLPPVSRPAAACAMIAGWIRVVGQVTTMVTGRLVTWEMAPITDQTKLDCPCSSSHEWK